MRFVAYFLLGTILGAGLVSDFWYKRVQHASSVAWSAAAATCEIRKSVPFGMTIELEDACLPDSGHYNLKVCEQRGNEMDDQPDELCFNRLNRSWSRCDNGAN